MRNENRLNQIEQLEKIEKEIFLKSAYGKEQLIEMDKNSNYLFITEEIAGKILGYIIAHNSYDVMEIMKIAVPDENRGKNVAKKIFDKLLKITELNIVLEVRESNLRAIKFYEKMGMEKISLRKGYYPDNGENAVIMFLEREQ